VEEKAEVQSASEKPLPFMRQAQGVYTGFWALPPLFSRTGLAGSHPRSEKGKLVNLLT